MHGDWGLENTGSLPSGIGGESLVAVEHVTLPAGSFLPLNPAMEGDPGVTLAAYDGATDYAGPSGITFHFANSTGGGHPFDFVDVYQSSWMQAYVASAQGQTIAITVDAVDASGTATPPLVEQYNLQASAAITITYVYDAHPAAFCRSDPSSGCPCQNLGAWGCSNSTNPSGGKLDVGGQASIANDTLVLFGSGMTNGLALYFQGTSLRYAGIAYGVGMRCAGGALRLIGAKVNSGGASEYRRPAIRRFRRERGAAGGDAVLPGELPGRADLLHRCDGQYHERHFGPLGSLSSQRGKKRNRGGSVNLYASSLLPSRAFVRGRRLEVRSGMTEQVTAHPIPAQMPLFKSRLIPAASFLAPTELPASAISEWDGGHQCRTVARHLSP